MEIRNNNQRLWSSPHQCPTNPWVPRTEQVKRQNQMKAPLSPLSSRAKPRDLQFTRPSPLRYRGQAGCVRGDSRSLCPRQDEKFTATERLNCRSLGFARDDKGDGGASIWSGGSNDNLTDLVHSSLNLPQASRLLIHRWSARPADD